LDFVTRVRDQTRRYVNDLVEENGALLKQIEVLACDKHLLESQTEALRAELEDERAERKKLFDRTESMEELRATSIEEYAIVEEQNNDVASPYSATYSLHGTLDREELLGVVREIVANLIGSEEMGVFERRSDGTLELVTSLGLDEHTYSSMTVDDGVIGHTIRTGARFLVGNDAPEVPRDEREAGLTACVPLAIGDQVVGAIAVFGLLSQKHGLAPLDLELFDLLGNQAAVALHAAKLHARYGLAES
jgi:hypothetical protein